MHRALCLVCLAALSLPPTARAELRAGFAHVDITPELKKDNPVWLAGYRPGRPAEGVHDPIYARCLALDDGERKIAIVCVDLVGLQFPQVQAIRKQLTDFHYVMVSSTHNHEGPDVVGIWGKTLVQRGVAPGYLQRVVKDCVKSVRQADKQMAKVQTRFGVAQDSTLIRDSRKPEVKDDTLRVLEFRAGDRPKGLLVQWGSHPEAMGSRNRQLTADYPAWTIKALTEKYKCPVVFVVGAVGGLMAPPRRGLLDKDGKELREGQFEFTAAYGRKIGELAIRAIDAGETIRLTPFRVSSKASYIPVRNPYYRTARMLGVLRRSGFVWTGDADKRGAPLANGKPSDTMAIETEVAYLRLGELDLAAIPGEIYPELVYGKIQDPVDPGADHPTAAKEPSVVDILPQKRWMLIGLANDEIGYIIPKRQWDQKPPYAYGRKSSQYGELNSCGADVAPLIMKALQDRVRALK